MARVDKEKKDEKIKYEFTPSKEEGVGVHITLEMCIRDRPYSPSLMMSTLPTGTNGQTTSTQ